MAEDLCPECGTPLEFDEVDIGVGVVRGNYHCHACGWEPKVRVLEDIRDVFPDD